jgi:hypothetical protein
MVGLRHCLNQHIVFSSQAQNLPFHLKLYFSDTFFKESAFLIFVIFKGFDFHVHHHHQSFHTENFMMIGGMWTPTVFSNTRCQSFLVNNYFFRQNNQIQHNFRRW